jgi:hypothetical protein
VMARSSNSVISLPISHCFVLMACHNPTIFAFHTKHGWEDEIFLAFQVGGYLLHQYLTYLAFRQPKSLYGAGFYACDFQGFPTTTSPPTAKPTE